MLTLSTRKTFNCLSSYAIETISDSASADLSVRNLKTLQTFFKGLPPDPYLMGNYRFRRFSRFKMMNNQLIQLPHAFFYQSKTYNQLLGNVRRDYGELDAGLVKSEDFQRVVLTFLDFCKLCSPFQSVGIHQIRITADPSEPGNPAPEGVHQDGVDLVGILCVDRHQIKGAETHLSLEKEAGPIFRKVLNPGELLVFNDHQFFHYTTPISPAGVNGYRDVFVFTCPDMPFETPE